MSSFRSNINMDEHEKNLMTGTLEQRKEAFKEDEELMRETTKFISEVIETAATEASKRKIQSEVHKWIRDLLFEKRNFHYGKQSSTRDILIINKAIYL